MGEDRTYTVKIVAVEDGRILVEGNPYLFKDLRIGLKPPSTHNYILDIAEVAYIIYSGAGKVLDEMGRELSLEDVFARYSRSKYDWVKFSVFVDLRNRGRVARVGYSENVLLVEFGSRKFAVYVAEENSPLKSGDILVWVDKALMKGYEPVLALVDAHGDVTYYTLRTQKLEDLKV